MGIEYGLDTNVNVKFAEFTLPVTNLYIDSLRTDIENRIFVGKHTDDLFGTVHTEGYMALSYRGGLPNFETDFRYESANIILQSRLGIPSQTSFLQGLEAFVLGDTLQTGVVYLASNVQRKERRIGSAEASFVPNDTIYFNIGLTREFGSELFNYMKTLSTLFNQPWPSIAISSTARSEGINIVNLLADSTSLFISIYDPVQVVNGDTVFHELNGESVPKDTTYVGSFMLSSIYYSSVDRSAATYSTVKRNVDFTLSDGKTYIDPLYGISTAFDIEQLNSFFQSRENIIFNNATISFEFENETARDVLPNFYVFFRKEDGFFGPASVLNSFQNLIISDQGYLDNRAIPVISAFNQDEDRINVLTTLFFQRLYVSYQENRELVFEDFLLDDSFPLSKFVLISQDNVTLQRTIFRQNSVNLKVYYTEVD